MSVIYEWVQDMKRPASQPASKLFGVASVSLAGKSICKSLGLSVSLSVIEES